MESVTATAVQAFAVPGSVNSLGGRRFHAATLGRSPHTGARARCRTAVRVGLEPGNGGDGDMEENPLIGDVMRDFPAIQTFNAQDSGRTLPDEAEALASGRVRELPLFPLGLVLVPGGTCPLHIFELRYRLLFNRIKEGDSMFGIVMSLPGDGLVTTYGTVAELDQMHNFSDGRMMTNSTGGQRFRILRYIDTKPYIRAMVEIIDDDISLADDKTLDQMAIDAEEIYSCLDRVTTVLGKLHEKEINVSAGPERPTMCPPGGWVNKEKAYRSLSDWSFSALRVVALEDEQVQSLIQTRDAAKRMAAIRATMELILSFLSAKLMLKETLN